MLRLFVIANFIFVKLYSKVSKVKENDDKKKYGKGEKEN